MIAARLVVPDAPTEADRAAILSGLAAFNRGHADPGAVDTVAVLLRDDGGTTIGGVWGATLFGWLHIELMFVPATMRSAGTGSAILARAEAIAADRGCIGVWLDTYSFQARDFYERCGYTPAGTIPDCPPGGARYFMQKRIDFAG